VSAKCDIDQTWPTWLHSNSRQPRPFRLEPTHALINMTHIGRAWAQPNSIWCGSRSTQLALGLGWLKLTWSNWLN